MADGIMTEPTDKPKRKHGGARPGSGAKPQRVIIETGSHWQVDMGGNDKEIAEAYVLFKDVLALVIDDERQIIIRHISTMV